MLNIALVKSTYLAVMVFVLVPKVAIQSAISKPCASKTSYACLLWASARIVSVVPKEVLPFLEIPTFDFFPFPRSTINPILLNTLTKFLYPFIYIYLSSRHIFHNLKPQRHSVRKHTHLCIVGSLMQLQFFATSLTRAGNIFLKSVIDRLQPLGVD